MFNTGWFRLWLLLSLAVLSAALVWSAHFVWGEDACRKLVTISIAESAPLDQRSLARAIEGKLVSQPHCGSNLNSEFLTLDSLAKQGAVIQVAMQWLEPTGWTEEIDILDGKEVSSEHLITRSTKYVRESRIKHVFPFLAAALGLCLTTLILGLGIAWVRAGFRNSA